MTHILKHHCSTASRLQVMTEPELLEIACEQFLGKSVNHVRQVILQTLEGHLRAILGLCLVASVSQDGVISCAVNQLSFLFFHLQAR